MEINIILVKGVTPNLMASPIGSRFSCFLPLTFDL
jgi:hypothetical protein